MFLHRLASALRWLTHRSRMEQDLDDELQTFVDMAAADEARNGAPAHEARRLALLRLGGVEQAKERVRTARHGAWFDDVGRHTRFALRQFTRRPGHSAIAVILLATGIGVAVTGFGQVNAVVWKDLRVKEPGSLRQLTWTSPKRAFAGDTFGPSYDSRIAAGETIATFPYPAYARLRDSATQFSDVACWRPQFVNLPDTGRVQLQLVSGNYFDAFAVGPALGRAITPDDDFPGAAPITVLSHRFSQKAFGGDQAALNQTLRINGVPLTVVGIAPDYFFGVDPVQAPDVWVPITSYSIATGSAQLENVRSWTTCQIVARLRPGAQDAGARAEAERLVQQVVQENPPQQAYDPPTVHLLDARKGVDTLRRATRFPLFLGLGAAAVILVIACANVSALLLASGMSRRNEIAMRFALGASKRRIMLESLTESLVLGILASGAGFLIAYGLSPVMPRLLHELTTVGSLGVFGLDAQPDLNAAGFAIGLALLTSVGVGIVPALTMIQGDLMSNVRCGATEANMSGRRWVRGRALIAIQVALAVVLVIGASQFLRSYLNLRAVSLGYDPHGLQFFTVSPQLRETAPGARRSFVLDVVDRLEQLPGVSAASASMYPLFTSGGAEMQICPHGSASYPEEPVAVDGDQIAPKFFATWKISLTAGRDLRWDDTNAVVVNAAFANRFYDDQDVVGRTVGVGHHCSTAMTVVGVASNSTDNPRVVPQPFIYMPYAQTPFATFAFRAETPGVVSAASARRLIGGLDARLLTSLTTGDELRDETVTQERFLSVLLMVLGTWAIVLCGMGIYGLLAYSVEARRTELGIRIALGASARDVGWTLTKDIVAPLVCGVVVGIIIAILAGRWFEIALFEVPRADWVALVISVAVSIAVGGLAALIPAWRAVTVQPGAVLRA